MPVGDETIWRTRSIVALYSLCILVQLTEGNSHVGVQAATFSLLQKKEKKKKNSFPFFNFLLFFFFDGWLWMGCTTNGHQSASSSIQSAVCAELAPAAIVETLLSIYRCCALSLPPTRALTSSLSLSLFRVASRFNQSPLLSVPSSCCAWTCAGASAGGVGRRNLFWFFFFSKD